VEWQPIETAPKGKLIWGWLYDTGIKLLQWSEEYECGSWVEANDHDQDWMPTFWLPHEAITVPPGVSAVTMNGKIRFRDADDRVRVKAHG